MLRYIFKLYNFGGLFFYFTVILINLMQMLLLKKLILYIFHMLFLTIGVYTRLKDEKDYAKLPPDTSNTIVIINLIYFLNLSHFIELALDKV